MKNRLNIQIGFVTAVVVCLGGCATSQNAGPYLSSAVIRQDEVDPPSPHASTPAVKTDRHIADALARLGGLQDRRDRLRRMVLAEVPADLRDPRDTAPQRHFDFETYRASRMEFLDALQQINYDLEEQLERLRKTLLWDPVPMEEEANKPVEATR